MRAISLYPNPATYTYLQDACACLESLMIFYHAPLWDKTLRILRIHQILIMKTPNAASLMSYAYPLLYITQLCAQWRIQLLKFSNLFFGRCGIIPVGLRAYIDIRIISTESILWTIFLWHRLWLYVCMYLLYCMYVCVFVGTRWGAKLHVLSDHFEWEAEHIPVVLRVSKGLYIVGSYFKRVFLDEEWQLHVLSSGSFFGIYADSFLWFLESDSLQCGTNLYYYAALLYILIVFSDCRISMRSKIACIIWPLRVGGGTYSCGSERLLLPLFAVYCDNILHDEVNYTILLWAAWACDLGCVFFVGEIFKMKIFSNCLRSWVCTKHVSDSIPVVLSATHIVIVIDYSLLFAVYFHRSEPNRNGQWPDNKLGAVDEARAGGQGEDALVLPWSHRAQASGGWRRLD